MYEARKDLFIKKLGQLLAMTREGITEAEYEKSYDFENKKEYAEFVVIKYSDGAEKRINVTLDSNLAVIKDVMRAI